MLKTVNHQTLEYVKTLCQPGDSSRRCVPPSVNAWFIFNSCMQQQCHESTVKGAIQADDAAAVIAALDRPRCLGAPKPDVNMAARDALLMAAASASCEVLGALLDKGADVNVTDDAGNTALHVASKRGDTDVLARLIKAGPNIDCLNGSSVSPLLIAASHGNWPCCSMLLKARASARPVGFRSTESARLAFEGADEVVEMLGSLWPQVYFRFRLAAPFVLCPSLPPPPPPPHPGPTHVSPNPTPPPSTHRLA